MSNRYGYTFLTLMAATVLFFSCKPKTSKDDPLPVSYSPSVIVGSNNQVLYALDPSSGAKHWELGLSFPITSSPIIYGGFVYVASSLRDTIYKINSKTGEVIKKISFGGSGCKATPIADGGLIYVASMNNTLYAIDTGTYKTKWSYSANGPLEASPTIHNGFIYFASTSTVYKMEKTNGTTATMPAPPNPTWTLDLPLTKLVSSPAIAEPYLFIGSLTDSAMYCIYLDVPETVPATTTGILRWAYKTNGGIASSPTATGGLCIFGCNDFGVYCLDTTVDPTVMPAQPELRWRKSTKSEVTSSPVVANQVVYVGCKDYKLYALDILDGTKERWTFSANGIITSSPLVHNGKVYIGSFDRQLYTLDATKGTLIWKTSINGQIECSPVLDDLTKATGHSTQISGAVN